MKKIFTQSLIVVICLLPCLLAQAQNKVTGIAITPTQVGIVTYGNASSATYTVTLTTDGGSPDGTSDLSLNWVAPAGVSYSFSPASPVTLAAGSISQNVTLTITSDGTTDAGSYNFTVSCTNDVFTSGNASFVVAQAPLTIAALPQTKTYVKTVSTTGVLNTTFTVTGLLNGDAVSGATLDYSGSPSGDLATAATGSYSITPSAAIFSNGSADNYAIAYNDGTLTVDPALLTITADNDTKVYGTVFPTGAGSIAFTSTGLQNSETIGSVTITSIGAPANAAVAGSPYPIVPSAATSGTFNAANYTISYIDGSLTVTPATLTITANDDTKVYGTVFPVGAGSAAFTSIGLQNSETIGSVTIASTGAPANATVAGSPYPIVASAATDGTFNAANYTITYVDGSLTVTPATLTITANDDTKVYGTVFPTGAGSIAFASTGLQNSETIGSITTASTGAPANATVAGSPYPIVPSAATGGTFNVTNYNIVYANGTLTVTKAVLTIKANDRTKVYGTTLTLGTTAFTPTGLQNGETIGGVTLTSAGAINTANVGTYPVIPSGATGGTFNANNYTITYTNGTLTVTPAPLTITANNQSKVYGTTATLGTTAFTATGLLFSQTVGGVTLTSTGSINTAPVGTYPIVPSNATGGTFNPANYSITYVNGILTITKPTLTITANNGTKVYGTVFPTGAGSIAFISTGLQNSETIGSITTASTGAPANATVAGSPYPIVPSAATGGTFNVANYNIVYANGTLTVTKAVLTIKANDRTKVYGTTLTLGTTAFTPTGLQNGETIGGVTLTSAGAINTANVGTYPVIPSGATGGTFNANNYTITYTNGTLSVTPAPLTITANNQSKVYGTTATLGTTAFTATGLLFSQTIGGVTLNSTGSVNTAPVGTYPIVPSNATGGTFNPANYSITYVNGILTVTKASTTTTIVSNNNPACLGSSITFTATITSTLSNAGGQVQFFDGATLLGTGTISGTTAVFSTSLLSAGAHPLIHATYLGDGNYNGSSSGNLTQTVNTPASISSQPTNKTICAGTGSATFSVTVTGTSPTYQWQYSPDNAAWSNITNGTPPNITYAVTSNTTTSTLTVTPSAAAVSGTYYYRCIVNVSGCAAPATSNSGSLTVYAQPTATAGADQTVACGTFTTTLAANTPVSPATGMWTIVSGGTGTFANPNSPTSTFTATGNTGDIYTLRWTVSNGTCTSASDNITIKFNFNLNGLYSVGSGNVAGEQGHFSTLTRAIDNYNTCLGGNTTFVLTNANYSTNETFPLVIGNPATSSTKTLTIKPNTGVNATITGSNSTAIIELNGADYITIDGSNNGSTSRNLIIQNTSTSSYTQGAPVWIASRSVSDGATNNTIKNSSILGSGTASAWAGIVSGSNSSYPDQADAPNDNNTIQNCSFSNAVNGIYIYGAATKDQNWSIINNVVTSGYSAGILIQYANAFNITGNSVSGINANALFNGNTSGIEVTSNGSNFTISNNTISGVTTSTAPITLGGTTGILLGSTTGSIQTAIVSDNIISAVSNTGGFVATNTDGIRVLGSSQAISITRNTISNISASSSGSAQPAVGIEFSGSSTGANAIAYNKITGISQTVSGGYGAEGILLAATGTGLNISVYNNFISNVVSSGSSGTPDYNSNGYGIAVNSGGGYKIYYNSINLTTNQSTGTSAAIFVSSAVNTTNAIDLRNNIFANNQSTNTRYSIYSGAAKTVYSNIDYNDYWSAGTLGFLGGAQATIAAWRTATGKDVNSVSIQPVFTSATDLHLNPASNATLDNLGTPISGITDDIDADIRNTVTPDMGADEFNSCGAALITWLGGTSTDWNTAANWCGNAVPTSTTSALIPAGTVFQPLISNADARAISVTIASGTSLTMSGGYNLILSSGSVFTNNGTFTASSSTGAIIFAGAGTVAGTSTTSFNNITTNGNLALTTAPVITGTFQINGGIVSVTSPTYTNTSTLIYNVTGSYTTGNEWNAGAASTIATGVGIPQNVTIQSGLVSIPVSGGTADRALAGNLLINTGASFTLSSTLNHNLYILGNWTNSGTFTHNNRTVTFIGSSDQTITGSTAFYDLTETQGAGANLIYAATKTIIDRNLTVNSGTMSPNANTLVEFTGAGNLAGANNKVFYDLQIDNTSTMTITSASVDIAHNFVNNGIYTYTLGPGRLTAFNGKTGVPQTLSGLSTATTNLWNLAIGNNLLGASATTLIASSDFVVNGGSMTFLIGSIYNGSNNTATFSTTPAVISGSGTANFYNATTDVGLNPGSGIATINNSLTINTNGSIVTNAPVYGSAATLIYNTTTPTLNTGIEWTGNSGSTGAGSPNNVTVQNLNSVLLSGSSTVPGTLNVATGNGLDINSDTLTVNTGFSGNGNLKGSAASGLITSGTGTIYFSPASPYNQLKTFLVRSGGNVTLGGSITSGDTLNIIAGDSTSGYGTLTVNGSLHTGNLLTLKSDVNGTALVGPSTGVINDTVAVERYFPALRAWRFVAVPFSSSNQTINSAWQEGLVNSVLQCPSQFTGTPGYGTEISGGSPANGYDVNNTGYPSIKVYQNNAWIVPVSTYSNLVTTSANNAYTLFVRGDRSVCLTNVYPADVTTLRPRGTLNQQGSSTYTVNFSGAKASDFIFIGNPYAAPLDIRPAVKTNNSGIEVDKFWVWNPTLGGALGVGGYVAFSNGVQVPYNLIDTTNYAANTVIQSGESFMVQVNSSNSTGMGSVTFKENDKSSEERTTGVFGWLASPKQSSQSSLTQPSPKQRNPYTPPVLYVNMLDQNNAIMDGVGVAFGNKYSPYIDSIDAQKKWNEEIENMAIVKHDTTLAIDFRPVAKVSDTVFIRVYLRQHPYTLQIFTRGVREDLPAEGWLVDKYLGTQTQLDIYHVNLYSFTPNSDTNSYRNRFMLVFNRTGKKQQQDKGIKTSTNTVAGSSLVNGGSVSIYPNPVTAGTAMLNFNNMPAGSYQLIVYNAVGEKLSESMIRHSGGNTTYPLQVKSSWGSGIYNVRIVNTTEDNVKNISFILNK